LRRPPDPGERWPGPRQGPSRSLDGLALRLQCASTGEIERNGWPAGVPPTAASGLDASDGALADQFSFEFAHGRDHREREPARRRRSVDAVAQADKVHAADPEVLQRREQVARAACEPIEAPRGHDVELARVCELHKFVELGAPVLRAADPYIHELADNVPPTLAGNLAKLVELHLGVLIAAGGHPRIQSNTGCVRPGTVLGHESNTRQRRLISRRSDRFSSGDPHGQDQRGRGTGAASNTLGSADDELGKHGSLV